MAEPFRGAPTRIGRVLLAVFGAPFILTALLLIGFTLIGDDTAGEKLAMVIGAVIFAGAGLFLWAPAFPGVVNRALLSDSRFVKKLRPHLPPLVMGGMVVLMGLVPVLAAIGIVPTDDDFWEAPRWVGGIAGGLFVVAGVFILTKPIVDRLEPRLKKQVSGLFPLLIVSGLATIAGWVAFGTGERQFESSASNWLIGVSWGGDELIGRVVFGLGAVALIVVTVIGWWRYLTGRW